MKYLKQRIHFFHHEIYEVYAHSRVLKREKVRGPLEDCMAKFPNVHADASSLRLITRVPIEVGRS